MVQRRHPRLPGEPESNVDHLVGVAAGIPAGAVAKMRKQRMDAGIDFLVAGCVLNLSTLYVDNIKSVDCNLTELQPTAGDLVAKRKIIAYIDQHQQSHHDQARPTNRTFHGFSAVLHWRAIYFTCGKSRRPDKVLSNTRRARRGVGIPIQDEPEGGGTLRIDHAFARSRETESRADPGFPERQRNHSVRRPNSSAYLSQDRTSARSAGVPPTESPSAGFVAQLCGEDDEAEPGAGDAIDRSLSAINGRTGDITFRSVTLAPTWNCWPSAMRRTTNLGGPATRRVRVPIVWEGGPTEPP